MFRREEIKLGPLWPNGLTNSGHPLAIRWLGLHYKCIKRCSNPNPNPLPLPTSHPVVAPSRRLPLPTRYLTSPPLPHSDPRCPPSPPLPSTDLPATTPCGWCGSKLGVAGNRRWSPRACSSSTPWTRTWWRSWTAASACTGSGRCPRARPTTSSSARTRAPSASSSATQCRLLLRRHRPRRPRQVPWARDPGHQHPRRPHRRRRRPRLRARHRRPPKDLAVRPIRPRRPLEGQGRLRTNHEGASGFASSFLFLMSNPSLVVSFPAHIARSCLSTLLLNMIWLVDTLALFRCLCSIWPQI
jgi:hypothetical protein